MTELREFDDVECPACGAHDALVAVRSNAAAILCRGCGRVDVRPLSPASRIPPQAQPGRIIALRPNAYPLRTLVHA